MVRSDTRQLRTYCSIIRRTLVSPCDDVIAPSFPMTNQNEWFKMKHCLHRVANFMYVVPRRIEKKYNRTWISGTVNKQRIPAYSDIPFGLYTHSHCQNETYPTHPGNSASILWPSVVRNYRATSLSLFIIRLIVVALYVRLKFCKQNLIRSFTSIFGIFPYTSKAGSSLQLSNHCCSRLP